MPEKNVIMEFVVNSEKRINEAYRIVYKEDMASFEKVLRNRDSDETTLEDKFSEGILDVEYMEDGKWCEYIPDTVTFTGRRLDNYDVTSDVLTAYLMNDVSMTYEFVCPALIHLKEEVQKDGVKLEVEGKEVLLPKSFPDFKYNCECYELDVATEDYLFYTGKDSDYFCMFGKEGCLITDSQFFVEEALYQECEDIAKGEAKIVYQTEDFAKWYKENEAEFLQNLEEEQER